MPTVLRWRGLRFVIYSNDHRPEHVHVIGRDYEAVFNLHCPAGLVELRENYGFPKRKLTQIRRELTSHLVDLCQAWERIHGIE